MSLHICRVSLEPSSVYKKNTQNICLLTVCFLISLHLIYFWWHWAHKPSVTLQFMALPRKWRFNSWCDRQIWHSCGVWQWQVLFMPPTMAKLKGHIALGLSVGPSVRPSISRCIRSKFIKIQFWNYIFGFLIKNNWHIFLSLDYLPLWSYATLNGHDIL